MKINVAGLVCFDGKSAYYYEENHKKLVLGIGCMKFVFYGQEESFVVQFAIENINVIFSWSKDTC